MAFKRTGPRVLVPRSSANVTCSPENEPPTDEVRSVRGACVGSWAGTRILCPREARSCAFGKTIRIRDDSLRWGLERVAGAHAYAIPILFSTSIDVAIVPSCSRIRAAKLLQRTVVFVILPTILKMRQALLSRSRRALELHSLSGSFTIGHQSENCAPKSSKLVLH